MILQIREWLARRGFPADIEISPMAPGLGHTTMWRVAGAATHGDLVLRMFPAGATVFADREALAMRAASMAGVPVPSVVTTGEIDNHAVLLMSLVPGGTVASVLGREPEGAFPLGERLGRLLGEINRIPAPAGLAPAERWLERAGPALAPLRERLEALSRADRLLHLDYHPENVLMDGDEVTGVIDWTNTLPGPPHIDLGRSRAILQMVPTLPEIAPEMASAIEALATGLAAGHASVHGPDPYPDLSLAWGVGMICVDFAPQAELPGSWVTPELVAALETKRDRLIARVLGS